MSYADAAAKGAKQTPEEAAAPQPPEIIPNESSSTASLIDVDMPSVHTVPPDFLEQDVQTAAGSWGTAPGACTRGGCWTGSTSAWASACLLPWARWRRCWDVICTRASRAIRD
ncbi:hypothetical protein M440DRAFT_1404407, partial [Trichoderma longibrachiatum ATCC 18648]